MYIERRLLNDKDQIISYPLSDEINFLTNLRLDFYYAGSREIRWDSESLFWRRITILATQLVVARLSLLLVPRPVEPKP